MKYIVKIIATATEQNQNFAGQVNTYYVGKGGYIHDEAKWCEGWSRKHFADRYIKTDLEWKNSSCLEYTKWWKYEYEIMTI